MFPGRIAMPEGSHASRGDSRVTGSTTSFPTEVTMRFYQGRHGFYCGVDLHARMMHACVVDAEGVTPGAPGGLSASARDA